MRTNKNLYLFAAALVAGTMGMTSCSNEVVPEVENNPTYNGESVKTQFALNIPAAKKTRMSGTNTQQADNSFLGMQNIKLLPLFSEAAEATELKQIISLANIAKEGGWTGTNTKIYSDVNIPVNTTHFLFYAEAAGSKDAAGMTTGDDAFANGVLNNTLNNSDVNTVEKIKFNLVSIANQKGFDFSVAEAKEILAALEAVVKTSGWKDYADESTNDNKVLDKLYNKFIQLKAGSAKSVVSVLQTLQSELAKIAVTESSAEKTVIDAINATLKQYIGDNGISGDLADNTFPRSYNLPDGAVAISWAEDGTPSYATSSDIMGSIMPLNPSNICYPASLTYFVNTPLKATSATTINWPGSNTEWGSGFSGWGTKVEASTTGIALQKVINYAVANLVTSVKCKTAVLEDNAYEKTNHAEQNRKVIVPGTGFPVTGILIGGQPNSVDWQLLPTTDDSDRDMVVYDKDIVEGMAAKYHASDYSAENYTLLLDNRKKTKTTLAEAAVINIALEFTNNTGTDFYGADGLIKDGATFYMVAKLDANAGEATNTTDRKSVFEQDYKTVAKLTIGSLAKAYNCIPDLRSTQLQLGMAVDLTWQTGITFDVELGE